MPSVAKKLLFLCFVMLLSHPSLAHEASSFRKLFSYINFSASTGYGHSYYSYAINKIDSTGDKVVLQKDNKTYIKTREGKYYQILWPHNAYQEVEITEANDHKSAFGREGFNGTDHTVPVLTLIGYVDPWRKARIGFGVTVFNNKLRELKPVGNYGNLEAYKSSQTEYYCVRPLALFGIKLIETPTFSLLFDVNLGVDIIYTQDAPKISSDQRGGVQNAGLTLERHFSEYLRGFVRGSIELSSDGRKLDNSTRISKGRTGGLFQIGLSFSYPEIPRCTLPGCAIEGKHRHGGKTYRGASIFTGRDSQGELISTK